jgi:hypothetical protein
MKKTIREFIANCGNLFRREKAEPDSPAMAKYREFFNEELERIQKNPHWAAHIFASDRLDNYLDDIEDKLANGPKASGSCDKNSVGNELEPAQPDTGVAKPKKTLRQLFENNGEKPIALHYGKSYNPAIAENCHHRGPELGDD